MTDNTSQKFGDNRETAIREYEDGCQIIHEERMYPDLYHFEGPERRLESFENLPAARLYADVYTVTDGFTEKQTGKRGVPPSVARASEDIRIAYLAAQMSITYAARAFTVDETAVRDTVDRIHKRAEKQRSESDSSCK